MNRGASITGIFIDEVDNFMSDNEQFARIRVETITSSSENPKFIVFKFTGKFTLTQEQLELFGENPRIAVVERAQHSLGFPLQGTLSGDIVTVLEDRVKELETELTRYRKKYGVL